MGMSNILRLLVWNRMVKFHNLAPYPPTMRINVSQNRWHNCNNLFSMQCMHHNETVTFPCVTLLVFGDFVTYQTIRSARQHIPMQGVTCLFLKESPPACLFTQLLMRLCDSRAEICLAWSSTKISYSSCCRAVLGLSSCGSVKATATMT